MVNRLVLPPMATAKAEINGRVSQAVLNRYAEKMLLEGKAVLIGVGRAILKDSNWAKQAITSLAWDRLRREKDSVKGSES